MTEDPVKLYVVVMSVLLAVLGYVAWKSHVDAQSYEDALRRAPNEAATLRDNAAEVNRLCDQLQRSKIGVGEANLVESAARRNAIEITLKRGEDRVRGSSKGQELKLTCRFGSVGSSKPVSRRAIAKFCQDVEADSQGILKPLEIELSRAKGSAYAAPGERDEVTDDVYSGTIVFAKRFIEAQE